MRNLTSKGRSISQSHAIYIYKKTEQEMNIYVCKHLLGRLSFCEQHKCPLYWIVCWWIEEGLIGRITIMQCLCEQRKQLHTLNPLLLVRFDGNEKTVRMFQVFANIYALVVIILIIVNQVWQQKKVFWGFQNSFKKMQSVQLFLSLRISMIHFKFS